jgi:hypothetical protein
VHRTFCILLVFYSVSKCGLWVHVPLVSFAVCFISWCWPEEGYHVQVVVQLRTLCVGLLGWDAPTEICHNMTFVISVYFGESMTMIGH